MNCTKLKTWLPRLAPIVLLVMAAPGCDDEPAYWCPPSLTSCDGTCAATNADPKNCGKCGNTCKTGELCVGGTCSTSCLGGTTVCSDKCVDLQIDPKNCGVCGTTCKAGEVCSAGKCGITCVGGTTACSGICVDVQVDPKNCGTCGTMCNAGEVCSAGKCTVSCGSGTVNCSGVCTCTLLDPKNCGACGKVCASGLVCSLGKCGLSCLGGTTLCSNKCVDTKVDPQNCGKCGNACKTGDICLGGTCQGVCGDGIIGTNEVCDRGALNAQTCKTFKYGGGTLACASGCKKFDFSGCTWAYAGVLTTSGEASMEASGIALADDGSVHIIGAYPDTATFGTTKLTTTGSDDVFVVRVTPPGTTAFAVTLGGKIYDHGSDIAVDSSGNSYVVGNYYTSGTFGTVTLTSKGTRDAFVAKLDKTGKVLWANSMGGTSRYDEAIGVGLDSAGNVYVIGEYQGSTTVGTTTLTSKGSSDLFVAKFSNAGVFSWAISLGGTSYDVGNAIAVDSTGQSTLVASYQGSMTVGTTTLTSKGGGDVAVIRLDSTGKALWAVSAGGTGPEYGDGVVLDSSGNAFITGQFSGTGTFGNTSLVSKGSTDIFAAKVGSTGAFVWALSAGGTSSDYSGGIALDSAGSVYLTGSFRGSAAFGGVSLTSKGSRDIYVAKVDSTPRFRWAVSAGGTSGDDGVDIAVDSAGNSYVHGAFYGTVSFGGVTFKATNMDAPFIWKLDKDGN